MIKTNLKNWVKRKDSQGNLLVSLLLLFGLWYVLPLFNYQNNLAGSPQDPMAYAGMSAWFCDHFFKYDFVYHKFFAPFGVNLNSSYDTPLLIALACPLKTFGPAAMFNFMMGLQIFLIFGSAILVARTYLTSLPLQMSFILLYSFSSFSLARLPEHLNIITTIWGTALAFWVFDQLDLTQRKRVLLAFLTLSAIFLSGWQNIANLTFLVAYLLFKQWLPLPRKLKIRAVTNLVWGGLLLVVASAYFMLPILLATDSGNPGSGRSSWSADVLSYIVPFKNILWSKLLPPQVLKPGNELFASVDPVLLVLGACLFLYSLWKRQGDRMPLLGVAGLYALLSFGSSFALNRRVLFYYPTTLLLALSPRCLQPGRPFVWLW